MKKEHRITSVLVLSFLCLFAVLPVFAQETTTQWNLWVGNHYTGLNDYTLKVAEFDRNVDGFVPEFKLNFAQYRDNKGFGVNGYFYDPKRMGFTFEGNSSNLFEARVSYNSFYRQYQRDLMNNLIVREAGNREGTTMGGKMITHEDLNPAADYGFRRQEIRTDLGFKIPGLENIKVIASHRSILEKGSDQHMTTMHCSSCHIQSREIDLNRQTHSVSAGMEAKFNNILLTYTANYRMYKSDVNTVEVFYDTAQHPVNGQYVEEFSSRLNYAGENVPVVEKAEIDKFAHNLKLKAKVAKGLFLAQLINSNTKNKEGDLNLNGNQANLKFAYPVFKGGKFIASGVVGRYENDPVSIDLASWRENRAGGGQDFDWVRYSNLTRTEQKGAAELIYQPKSRYRLSLLTSYSSLERDDYPYADGNFKTTKLRLQAAVKYRPSMKFTGRFKYYFDNIDNPFAPYNIMFERSGRAANLTPPPNNSKVYYYQRDALRYGNITNLPTQVHGINLDLQFKPSPQVNFTAGVNMRLGSNSDAPELDFQQKSYQPKLAFTYVPGDKFSFFSSYSYLYQTQNGLATVAMMDG